MSDQVNSNDSDSVRGLVSEPHTMELEAIANRCFVCGPGSPHGLRVTFRLDGDVCRAEFTPGPEQAGYDQVTHGGILFSLLDDVMANWLWLRGEQCFTARADIRYRAPVPLGTPLRLEGRQLKRRGRLAILAGQILHGETDRILVEATGSFMVLE